MAVEQKGEIPSSDRIREIREAHESTNPRNRDPADVAIGELLAALDKAEKLVKLGNYYASGFGQLEKRYNMAREVVEAARCGQEIEGPCDSDCPDDCWSGRISKALKKYDEGVP